MSVCVYVCDYISNQPLQGGLSGNATIVHNSSILLTTLCLFPKAAMMLSPRRKYVVVVEDYTVFYGKF